MANINLRDLAKRTKLYQEQIEQVAKASLLRVGNNTVTRTPVDTGRAKGNWLSAYGSPNTSTDDSRRESDALGELRISIEGLEIGTEFYFTNSLPYIQKLEYGWSEQAPAGMLRVSIAEFPQIVQDEIRKVG